MSDVKMVKRFLVGASVSVLAGLLMSSAALAEDDAAPVGSDEIDVSITVEDPMVDPVAVEMTMTGEDGSDPELGDPTCADCSTGGPDISIDPIEMVGEVIDTPVEKDDETTTPDVTPDVTIDPIELDGAVIDTPVEVMQNEAPLSGGSDVQRDAVTSPSSSGRGEGTVARAAPAGQNPAWLKNLFKTK